MNEAFRSPDISCEYCNSVSKVHKKGCPNDALMNGANNGDFISQTISFNKGKDEALLERIDAPRSKDPSYLLGWEQGKIELSKSTPEQINEYKNKSVNPF